MRWRAWLRGPPSSVCWCSAVSSRWCFRRGYPRRSRMPPPWLLALVAAPLVLFVVEPRLSPTALRWERRIGLVLGLGAIPWITFTVAAAYFDFATIVGPVNDLLKGKDILDSVVSTYGFLFTYALAAIFRILRVTDLFIGVAVVNAVAYTVGYAAIFGFLYYRLKRLSLCLATMTAVIAIHYFHLHVPISWLPQSGFLRFGWVLPIFMALYALDDRRRSPSIELDLRRRLRNRAVLDGRGRRLPRAGLAAALGRGLLPGSRSDRLALRLIAKIAASALAVLAFFCIWIKLRHGHWPVCAICCTSSEPIQPA